MAEIAFDTLRYARRLKEAGVPDNQAEVQAELMGEAFGYSVGNLVTGGHLDAALDARFAGQRAWLESTLDARFRQQDEKLESRFRDQGDKFNARFREQDTTLTEIKSQLKLHSWGFALMAAAILLPTIKDLFSG
jgi:hypothetical protein